MRSSAIVTFLIIGSFVWGGVALIVMTAFRSEREKRRGAPASPPATTPPGARTTES